MICYDAVGHVVKAEAPVEDEYFNQLLRQSNAGPHPTTSREYLKYIKICPRLSQSVRGESDTLRNNKF